MKRLLLTILLCVSSLFVLAEEDAFKYIVSNYQELGGTMEVVDQTDDYIRIVLSENATVELFITDNIIAVFTVCAPQCSSRVRVYNKEWEYLFPMEPPFQSIFPLAAMDRETGRITWTDNDTWEYE